MTFINISPKLINTLGALVILRTSASSSRKATSLSWFVFGYWTHEDMREGYQTKPPVSAKRGINHYY